MRNGPDDDGFRARLAGRSHGNGNPFSRETDFPGFGVGGPRLQQEGVAFDKAGRFAGRGSPHDVLDRQGGDMAREGKFRPVLALQEDGCRVKAGQIESVIGTVAVGSAQFKTGLPVFKVIL